MKSILCSVLLLILSVNASANLLGTGFAAPTLTDTADVYNPQAGEIIFESTGSKFWGYTGSSWQQLSGSSGSTLVTHRALVNPTSGSTCVIDSQDQGSWSCTRNTTGDVTITMAGFSATPSCSCLVRNTTGLARSCVINLSTAPSSTTLRLRVSDVNDAAADNRMDVVCVGTP